MSYDVYELLQSESAVTFGIGNVAGLRTLDFVKMTQDVSARCRIS